MKQTAVEWLVNELEKLAELTGLNLKEEPIIKKALEMEKEQIFDAVYFGHLKGWLDNGVKNSFGEEYYNRTFKSKQYENTDGQND